MVWGGGGGREGRLQRSRVADEGKLHDSTRVALRVESSWALPYGNGLHTQK